jgi:protein-S-isoprenylcysteine O-methyltransferase Ste14
MTVGHRVFVGGTTAYFLIATQIEGRDVVRFHGEAHENYRSRVSGLLPLKKALNHITRVDGIETRDKFKE